MVKTRFSAMTALAALLMVLGLGFSSCKDRVPGPGEKSPRLGKGAGLLEAKKYQEAEAELRKAVEDNLNSARAHHLLGMALFRQGGDLVYEAFKEIDIACNLEPTPERLSARSELGPIAAARLVEEIAERDGFELSGDRLEAARRLSRPYLTEAALKSMLKAGDPRTAERIREALSGLDLFDGLAELAQNPLYSFRARMAALYLMADHPRLEQELSPYLTALFMIGLEQCEPWEMAARRDSITGAVVSASQDRVTDLARRDLDKMFFTLAEVIQKVSEEIDQDTRFECLSMSLNYFFDAPDFELLKYELELPAIEPA